MAKLTICAVSNRQGRPRGTVLAIMGDEIEFGSLEVMAEGVLRLHVQAPRNERELAKLLSYHESDEQRLRAPDGTLALRSRRLGDAMMDMLTARASADVDEIAICTLQEIIDGRESQAAPEGFTEREGIRLDAQVRTII